MNTTVKVLANVIKPRRKFDPSDKNDLLELKHFLEFGTWKTVCPFELESPFIEIPAMLYSKCAGYLISKIKA